MFRKNKKNICVESGFNSLKDFLDYLQQNKIKYKCIIDNSGNWCASVGNQSPKRFLKEQQEQEEAGDNESNNNN